MSTKPILLMTHSLLTKKDWCQTAPNTICAETGETWKQKAYRELIEALCRKPFEQVPNSPADYGNRFEAQVYRDAHKVPEKVSGSDKYREVVNYARGGMFQKFHTKDMELDDCIIRWYGILDVEFRDKILDLKTTAKFSANKYSDSGQDLIYRYLTDIEDFRYVVTVWESFPKIKAVHTVEGSSMAQNLLSTYLKGEVEDYIDWLKDLGLFELYRDCYSHNGKGWKSEIAKKGEGQAEKLEAFYQPFRVKHLAQFEEENEGF